MKPLRITVRLHNNRMVKLREELGLTQTTLAKAIGVGASEYCSLETTKRSPFRKDGKWRSTILKVAEYHGVSPEWLFPEIIQELEKNIAMREVNEEQLLEANAPLQIMAQEASNILSATVRKQLPEREQLILTLIYGLDGEDKHTLEEAGQSAGLSRERVRQLEARALKKIRDSLTEEQELTLTSVFSTVFP